MLETTNKYIKTRFNDTKFTKYIQAHTANNNNITSRCKYYNILQMTQSQKKWILHVGYPKALFLARYYSSYIQMISKTVQDKF